MQPSGFGQVRELCEQIRSRRGFRFGFSCTNGGELLIGGLSRDTLIYALQLIQLDASIAGATLPLAHMDHKACWNNQSSVIHSLLPLALSGCAVCLSKDALELPTVTLTESEYADIQLGTRRPESLSSTSTEPSSCAAPMLPITCAMHTPL